MDTSTILLDAGLIDTSGAPTSAPNFGAAPEVDRDAIDWGQTGLESGSDDEQPQAKPEVKVEAEAQAQPAQTFNDKPAPTTTYTPQQAAAIGRQTIQQQVQEAIIHGLSLRDSEGKQMYSLEQLQQQFAPMYEQQMARLETDVLKHQMAPYAQRMVAEDIARQHGIDPKEILSETSVDAMQAAARHIARLNRDVNFQARKASGKDAVEGGKGMSSGVSEAYEKLSPQQKIAFGLRRGDS